MIGTIMEIFIIFYGIYISIFVNKIEGLILLGAITIAIIFGFFIEKKLHNDWFYSWRQLKKLFANDAKDGKNE